MSTFADTINLAFSKKFLPSRRNLLNSCTVIFLKNNGSSPANLFFSSAAPEGLFGRYGFEPGTAAVI